MTTMHVEPERAGAAFANVGAAANSAAETALSALPGKDPLTAAVSAALSAMIAADKASLPIAAAEQAEAGLMGSQNVASYVQTDQASAAKLSDHSIAV